MQDTLTGLQKTFLEECSTVKNTQELDTLEQNYLGKKGKLKQILTGLKDLSIEEKKSIGQEANILRDTFIQHIHAKRQELEEEAIQKQLQEEDIDVSIAPPSPHTGHKHPISYTMEMLEDICISLGFRVEDGPHIEDEKHNFDMLNIPHDHPARDVWDTFWLSDTINDNKNIGDRLLLRTHTSPVQIRTMLKEKLPIKIIVPGKVFRYEQEDARHTCNFYQLEGLVVGEGVTFGNLKWTLDTIMKQLLGETTELRFRPSIFPFTEPSAEIDVSCQICGGTGILKASASKKCSMCSGTGWVELLGAGMVHPKVLEACGIDHTKYSGFAFGMGIDRIAAQRFGVSSSRMFYQSKLKLNEQF